MAKSEGEKGKEKGTGKEPRKGPGAGARFLAFVALIAVLAYILGGLSLSSGYVRRMVCDRVGQCLGVKVEAETSQLDLPFGILLGNVKSEGYEEGAGGLMFQRLRISPIIGGGWHVSCERGSVRLVCARDGVWGPPGLATLGPVAESDLAQVSKFTADFCDRNTLEASGLTVRWVRANGEVAAAGGVSFVARPTEVADRRMLYHSLRAVSLVGPGGERGTDVRREWLADAHRAYQEVVSEGGETKGRAFWEGTKP